MEIAIQLIILCYRLTFIVLRVVGPLALSPLRDEE